MLLNKCFKLYACVCSANCSFSGIEGIFIEYILIALDCECSRQVFLHIGLEFKFSIIVVNPA